MKSFLLIISFVSIISCKEKSEKDQIPIEVQQETTDVTETKESHENIDGTVSLNNGELWLANPETTEGIQKMKKRMALFNNSENLEAYVILKAGLEEDFTELFEKCTMKGEAHNQLHNYLFPFLDLFDGLETPDLVVCKKSFSELNIHLNEYSNYFKS
ncbi:MAG: hypothetical protein CMC00_04920 [Flavobacteriaceae bacterium]|nr:hypothetical protein [Flavobacteriaceae bacterium]